MQSNCGLEYASKKFNDSFYELGNKIGSGTSGEVYQVMLKDNTTRSIKKLFAGKVILESHLYSKNAEKKVENLKREIDILSIVDRQHAVTLVELIEIEADRTIIIQDYANGGSL